jgi:DNA-binding CsgD family transcriptional regulator
LIETFADRATSGALLCGSFGMGRSHLARQVANDLAARRVKVCWVSGARGGASPFAPLRPIALATGGTPPTTFEKARDLLGNDGHGAPPSVVVVDDAHMIPGELAEVLDHLASTGRSRMLLTARTGCTLPTELSAHVGATPGIRIELSPLDRSDVAGLCSEVLGAPADAALIDEVARRSTGRPRLARELLEWAQVRGAVQRRDDQWLLIGELDSNAAFGDLVRHELAAVGRRGRDLIEAVALARSLDANVLDTPWDGEVAEDLEDQGWLKAHVQSGGAALVSLAEPLLGDLIVDTLGTLRRRRHVARLAEHARRPASGLPTAQAVLLRNEAGESLPLDELRAATRCLVAEERITDAHKLARELWDRSAAAADGDQLGRVLTQLNRSDEAEQVFAAAHDRARSDAERAALILPRAENLWFAARSAEARAVCKRTLEALTDPRAKALVTAELANLCARDGDVGAASDALDGLGRSEASSGTPAVVAGLARTLAGVWGGRPDASVAPGALASAAAEEPTDDALPPRLYELVLLARAEALCFAGRFPEAVDWLDELHWCAIELRTSYGIAATALIRARLEVERGCITSSRPWTTRATHAFEIAGLGRFTTLTDELNAFVEARHGDVHLAQRLLAAAEGVDAVRPIGHAALDGRARAWVDHRLGDLDQATSRQLATVTTLIDRGALTDAIGVLADGAVMGRAEVFAPTAASLADAVDGPLLTSRLGMVVATAAGDVASLEHHGSVLAGIGSHLDAANAYALAATVAGERPDDRSARRDLARSIAAEAAGEGVRSIVLERLRPSIEQLTDREHLVARLAAQGLSSRDIATKLTISVRTVDNLLGRVYRKLHVNGRVELSEVLASG